jgi:pyridoxamine 5'-phosphate oxidase
MLSDDELVAGFEAARLAEFHHADHVRLTIVYLARHGRDEALHRLTAGIKRLAAAEGHPDKFHVTLTRAWLELIEAARARHPNASSAAALMAACPDLLDRNTLCRCYSRARLESERARTEWLPPDLDALDAAFVSAPDPKAGLRPHNDRMPSPDPITVFLEAVSRAQARQVDTAPVVLATADAQGRPSARMVLLRQADARGFAFFTNYTSRKARELVENPYAALCLHWPSLEEQIRVEGRVERLPDHESDEYFSGRPRGSQLGAWASDQSQVLASRDTLEERYREIERRFDGVPVERPSFWGGFRLVPDRMEFWQGRADRLHDRLVYVREDSGWRTELLYP